MNKYYLLMIDNCKFVIHKETSNLNVTLNNNGNVSDIVAIFTANDNWKHFTDLENFSEKIKDVLYYNHGFIAGSYKEKINNFLNNN